ncbi:arylsulfotransferase [Sutterella wadsworthensis CAG:135]|nr:arylsulfotransferase [Sutterella wadsworthensis CAG:135]
MKMKWIALAVAAAIPAAAMAIGGASGPKIDYEVQGHIGEVMGNPYGIAPLTAVIRDGGYTLADVTVHIVPKQGGQKISYKVSRSQLLTHGGVPVFGLYPDYLNTIRVDYTRIDTTGKKEKFSDEYKLYAPPVYFEPAGNTMERMMPFEAEVKKADPEFSDRLYFVNNFGQKSSIGTRAVWNNPTGGALEWNYWPQNTVIDTKGEVRWFMFANPIYDLNSLYSAGVMMGFKQNDDGAVSWGYGSTYVKYDIMGRKAFNRRLPAGYSDFSHSLDPMPNGHYLLRVASADLRRLDQKRVRTVRDMIIEVDAGGRVVDEWRLFDILDPYRSNVIKALDQGAVCLNIDPSKAGHTLTAEDLAKQETSANFGDFAGTGPGRNWAHVNSVDYDPTDDSIIISSRHQSAIIKIGRDKKVKWILGAPRGWRSPWKEALLTPVDAQGKPLKCGDAECGDAFDWTWTQHTAWRIDSKSDKNVIWVSVFDNGDARGMEQPALPEMKYSRAVIYKLAQVKQDRSGQAHRRAGLGIRQRTRPQLVQPGDVAHRVPAGQELSLCLLRHGRRRLRPYHRRYEGSSQPVH